MYVFLIEAELCSCIVLLLLLSVSDAVCLCGCFHSMEHGLNSFIFLSTPIPTSLGMFK